MKLTVNTDSKKPKSWKNPLVQGVPAQIGDIVEDESGDLFLVQGFQPIKDTVRILGMNIKSSTAWSLHPKNLHRVVTKPSADVMYEFLCAKISKDMLDLVESGKTNDSYMYIAAVLKIAYTILHTKGVENYSEYVQDLVEHLFSIDFDNTEDIESIYETVHTFEKENGFENYALNVDIDLDSIVKNNKEPKFAVEITDCDND